MCGIAGIITGHRAEPNLQAMLAAMKHRGPDDRGTWINEGVHLGHNRLSIIDLSSAGYQPMVSHSGRYVIVYNGEVYNFQTLRRELSAQGVRFFSHTDTEVILALWEREQEACISRLRGMFAFAIWDTREKKLTLVRDRLGIKPLYYAQTPEGFVFASEIKGMLASGLVEREINKTAIALIMQKGYVQQPHTILKSVSALMPGYLMQWRTQEAQTICYWQLKSEDHPFRNEQTSIASIRSLIVDAVNEEMVSDRPVGVFLSGGLDSTVLIAALRAAGQKEIKTFTVGFDSTNEKLSEASQARHTAQFYDTEHYNIQIERDNVWTSIDEYIEAIDQPSIDGLNVWLVSKHTSDHVTVAISGLGGDELFSGYSIDRSILYWQDMNSTLLNVIGLTEPIWKNVPIPAKIKRGLEARRRFLDFTDAYLSWGEINKAETAAQITGSKPPSHRGAVYDTFHTFAQGNFKDSLQRITAMHLNTFMSGRVLTVSDACSMAHSLEVRFPLIDHRLVELAYNLPQSWRIKRVRDAVKMKNFEAENSYEETKVKHLLYQAFKNDLPAGFGERAKKGFKLPLDHWLQAGLKQKMKEIFFDTNAYLPSSELHGLWSRWEKGLVNWGVIWTVFILESWIRRFIRA